MNGRNARFPENQQEFVSADRWSAAVASYLSIPSNRLIPAIGRGAYPRESLSQTSRGPAAKCERPAVGPIKGPSPRRAAFGHSQDLARSGNVAIHEAEASAKIAFPTKSCTEGAITFFIVCELAHTVSAANRLRFVSKGRWSEIGRSGTLLPRCSCSASQHVQKSRQSSDRL